MSKYSWSIVIINLIAPFWVISQNTLTMSKPIKLAKTKIEIKQSFNAPTKNILFLNVHHDEQTSIDAIQKFAVDVPLNFAYIHHQNTRRLFYKIGKKEFSVDPNRIYTKQGRAATIETDHKTTLRSKMLAKKLSKEIIELVEQFKIIVTLHNNSDVNYSIKSYLPGGDEAQNTAEVFVNPKMDPDDFIYTTDQHYFDYLKRANYNVILQDNTNYVNDGSLSVYCGSKQIPYLNIEAQLGHFDEQLKMIEVVYEMLTEIK
ncbi:MAG: hypothetical protein ACWA41_03285 [Putridiphycobacter sp.]